MPNPYIFNQGDTSKVSCVQCGKSHDLPVTTEQLLRWKSGELIQNAMPQLTKADRELFVSGVCGTCWISLFGAAPKTKGHRHSRTYSPGGSPP